MKKAYKGILLGLSVVAANFIVKEGTFLLFTVPARESELRGPHLEALRPSSPSPREGRRENDELVENYLLEDLYTVIRPEGELREKLYVAEAFDEVENALHEQFESIDNSIDRYHYGKAYDGLIRIHADDDPLKMKAVFDRWVRERPDSFYAALTRGSFMIEYAWYWRGGELGFMVAREDAAKFHSALEEASADLRRAMKLNPDDPEAPAFMITVAMGLDYDRYLMEHFYDAAMTLAPDHFRACVAKTVFMLPQWGGDWDWIEAFFDECDRNAETHPILGLTRVVDYGPEWPPWVDREDIFRRSKDEIVRRYDRVFAQSTDASLLRANKAYFLYRAGAYTEALPVFEMLGYAFYEGSAWDSVAGYAGAAAETMWAVAYDLEPKDPEKARELLLRATEFAPFEPEAYGQLGNHHFRFERYDEALKAYHDARRIDPADVRNYVRLCWTYLELGRYDEVIRYGEKALALGPIRADNHILNKCISFAQSQQG